MTLLPDEDSWSSRAKQFLRRDSFLRRARAKKAASPAKAGQAEKEDPSGGAEQPGLLSEGRLNSAETDDTLAGASPRSLDGGEFSSEPEEAALRRQESSAGAEAGPSSRRPNGLAAGEHSEDERTSQSRASQGESSGRTESAEAAAEDGQTSAQHLTESAGTPRRPRLPPLLWGPSSDQPSGQPPASPGHSRGPADAEGARGMSPRSDARSFMASVSGFVSSTEGAGGAKMRRPGWWRGPAVTSWTQYRLERSRLPPGCSPILVSLCMAILMPPPFAAYVDENVGGAACAYLFLKHLIESVPLLQVLGILVSMPRGRAEGLLCAGRCS